MKLCVADSRERKLSEEARRKPSEETLSRRVSAVVNSPQNQGATLIELTAVNFSVKLCS
jgi:hypothetical protein